MRTAIYLVLCCALSGAAPGAEPPESLAQVLSRMDRAAKAFEGMTADTKKLTYTKVIDDKSEETGVLRMRRTHGHDVQALWETTQPVNKTWEFHGKTARLFLPNAKQVEIFDFSKNGEEMDQFVLLGFGTPADELKKNYEIRFLGHEDSTAHIELTPKSEQGKALVTNIELWISDSNNYPAKEKLLQPSGDYILVTYQNIRLSPLPGEKDVQLSLPPGVQKIYPGK